MADSMKFPALKMPGYVSLLNQYLRMDNPRAALDYFNSGAGKNLQDYLRKFGLTGIIDQAYGVIYAELGKYDSAKVYFARAAPFFEKGLNEIQKMSFYQQEAALYEKTGENVKAIDYYIKVKDIALRNGLLENVEKSAKHLDSLYMRTGDLRTATEYSGMYYKFRDSVETQNKEKELAQVEAADEQQRMEKMQKEMEDREIRKNNIQYMSITIGIAALFVMLAVLGMFKVSASTIRFIGFFAFLMFFEFIFLLFKKNIHSITHGEPWKDLAFMIALAALLVPFHHWLEKKVLHYLTSHNRLTRAGQGIRDKIMGKARQEQ
jgi:tetratricopeptide (TPR) repeat protein